MINHARALLMNVLGTNSPGYSFPGEEYVPPTFQPLVLPAYASSLRTILFGPDPDRAMLNYRLRELLTLVHGCEMGDYLLKLDPRVTYWPVRDESLFRRAAYGTTSQQLDGSPTELFVIGDTRKLIHPNRLWNQWRISVTDGSTVQVRRTTVPTSITDVTYSVTNGLSSLVPLTGSDLSVSFRSGTGNVWLIQSYARPTVGIPGLVSNLENTDSATLEKLFGVAPAEPYRTFRNLWFDEPLGPGYRLAGLVTALTYRLNELLEARG